MGTGEFGQFSDECGESGGAVDGDDASVATHIAELIVMRARENLAAEAAHETYTWIVGSEVV